MDAMDNLYFKVDFFLGTSKLEVWCFPVFFLFGLCLISLLEVCYSPGGRVGACHFLTGKGRQAWTGARVRLEFKKNQVLTQLKCSGDLEILTRGGAGGSGALTPGKLHWFLFGRFLDICLAVYGLIVSGIESESNVNFWPGWLQIYQWHWVSHGINFTALY